MLPAWMYKEFLVELNESIPICNGLIAVFGTQTPHLFAIRYLLKDDKINLTTHLM